MAIVVSLLLALTMMPAAGIQSAFADEPAERPATTGGDVPLEGPAEGTGLGAEGNAEEADGPVAATVREDGSLVANGLIYKSEGDGATLVGFEDGNALEREVAVPEKLTDGALEYAVKGVAIAEGQTAPGVLALELPQTVEDVDTKSLATAMPALARVSVDGRGGAYSSANGMLFRQESITASSDGSTTRIANRELVWAPPAMVIARVPGTCKTVAPGAFVDDGALETVMVFSIVESVAKTEKDDKGNVTKEGAFTDEQVSKVNIVTPMETLVYPEGDRISTDAFLAEDAPLNEKHIPWCDCGFSMERFTVGIPYGSTSLAVAVPEDGRVGTPEITIGHYTDHSEWDPKGDTGEPEAGLVFEYKADMTVSVTWKGDKAAVPSHLELPAYVVENGVKTAVTEVAPNAFEGAAQLESVVVPEGVTTIGESAFAGCENLAEAGVPSTVKTLGTDALEGSGVDTSPLQSESTSVTPGLAESSGFVSDSFEEPASEWTNSLTAYSSIGITAGTEYGVYLYSCSESGFFKLTCLPESAFEISGSTVYTRVNSSYATLAFSYDGSLCFNTHSHYLAVANFYAPSSIYGYVILDIGKEYVISDVLLIDNTIKIFLADHSQLSTSWGSVVGKPTSFPPSTHSHKASDIQDQFVSSQLANAAVTSSKLADNAVTSAKIKDGTVAAADLVNGAVTGAKLASSTIAAGNLADGAVTNAKLAANAVGSGNIVDGTVATADLADNAVTSAKIANGSVTTDDLANNAVTSAKIVDGAIATADLANGAVASAKIADKNVTTAKLADGAVTNDKIANSTIDDSKLKSTFLKAKDIEGKADKDKFDALNSKVTNSSTGLDAKLNSADAQKTYVAKSEFGNITYSGLEGASSKSVMPTTYKKGFAPALPEPEKAGYEFEGWTCNGTALPTDANALKNVFNADSVTLTATWGAASASCFFSETPMDAASGGKNVIKVAVPGNNVQSVKLKKVDGSGLIEGHEASVKFAVGADSSIGGASATHAWSGGDNAWTGSGVTLTEEAGDGSWWLYVAIDVPADAINKGSVVKSYAPGDYVASLVTLEYTLA